MKRKSFMIGIILLFLVFGIIYFFSKTSNTSNDADIPFSRNPSKILYSEHAKCRMLCRHIDDSEIEEILQKGRFNQSRTKKNSKGISYAIEGKTHDAQLVRLVVAPKQNNTLLVVTVIDLEKEYPCNCN